MKLTVPTSWQDITVEQFQRIHKLNTSDLAKEDPIDYLLSLISICCKESYETISKFSIEQINTVGARLQFIQAMPPQKKIEQVIKLNREYLCELAIEKISAGQYIDLKNYIKHGVIENIHNILTCFYIPRMEKYAQTKPEIIANQFLKMSIADAYPIAVFFWNLVNSSMEIIQDYLVSETMDQIRKALALQVQTTDSMSITVG